MLLDGLRGNDTFLFLHLLHEKVEGKKRKKESDTMAMAFVRDSVKTATKDFKMRRSIRAPPEGCTLCFDIGFCGILNACVPPTNPA